MRENAPINSQCPSCCPFPPPRAAHGRSARRGVGRRNAGDRGNVTEAHSREFGNRSPPTGRAVCASVSLPASPYATVSGASPAPTPSRTIRITHENSGIGNGRARAGCSDGGVIRQHAEQRLERLDLSAAEIGPRHALRDPAHHFVADRIRPPGEIVERERSSPCVPTSTTSSPSRGNAGRSVRSTIVISIVTRPTIGTRRPPISIIRGRTSAAVSHGHSRPAPRRSRSHSPSCTTGVADRLARAHAARPHDSRLPAHDRPDVDTRRPPEGYSPYASSPGRIMSIVASRHRRWRRCSRCGPSGPRSRRRADAHQIHESRDLLACVVGSVSETGKCV